ncbi:MAG TPA: aminotransferase class V-fold PLP-dependent enzyme, partial [Tepidiformaceae bacterium]
MSEAYARGRTASTAGARGLLRFAVMIYLDHAATTRLHPLAREAMLPFLDGRFGNPSGLYEAGRDAQSAVDGARRTVAECLGARPSEILFTSGGTESINTAMLGIAYAMRRAGAGNHVITTAIEHHAGLHTAQALEELGFEITYVGCGPDGHVALAELESALRPETVLVSVMLANNEVGAVQPVEGVAETLRKYSRQKRHRVLLHTDAVQAPGWRPLD